jgi:hypothetical protein
MALVKNAECRKNDEAQSPKDETVPATVRSFVIGASGFFRH